MDLLDVSPIHFQIQIFWRLIFPVQVLRVGGTGCWAQTPHISVRNSVFVRSLLTVGHCAGGRVFAKTVSLPLLPVSMWPLFFFCGGSVQLALRSFSEGNVLYAIVVFVCSQEEVGSGMSYDVILNYFLPVVFYTWELVPLRKRPQRTCFRLLPCEDRTRRRLQLESGPYPTMLVPQCQTSGLQN